MSTINDLALETLSIPLFVQRITFPPRTSSDDIGKSPLGLPPSTIINNGGQTSGNAIGPNHWRVLGVEGRFLNCKSHLIIFADFGAPVLASPNPCPSLGEVYRVLVPAEGDSLPYVNMIWQPSLIDDMNDLDEGDIDLLGIDISGSASVSAEVSGSTIKVTISANAKVKVNGVKVLSVSEEFSVSKNLSELTPCVDITKTVGKLRVKGQLCLRGATVCVEDAELQVNYRGWKKVASISRICVGTSAQSTEASNAVNCPPVQRGCNC